MADSVAKNEADNPAFALAASSLLGMQKCNASSLIFMPYSDRLRTLGAWFVQLWAESLGKKLSSDGTREVRVGQTPVQAIGATDQHAQVHHRLLLRQVGQLPPAHHPRLGERLAAEEHGHRRRPLQRPP